MLLLIDNYDSFSFNLYQLIGELEPDIKVIRNDEMTVQEILDAAPDAIIISPGPGRPENAGMIVELVSVIGERKVRIPVLGVCLGHQAICTAFGGTITYASKLMHGKQSLTIFDKSSVLFRDVPDEALVARYHSLALDESTLPEVLRITARTVEGDVMAVEHKELPIFGMQFHPESIMTKDGKTILKAFIALTRQ